MVSKADYLSAARRIYGKRGATIHKQMGEAAHQYMRQGTKSPHTNQVELGEIIKRANAIANARLQSKQHHPIKRKRRP